MDSLDKVIVESRSDDIESLIFLKINSKAASSGPPIGPILGQYGIPAGPFCSEFNERTAIFKSGVELFVTIYLYKSGLYDFLIDLPSMFFFLKRATKCLYGTRTPGWVPIPHFTKDYEISIVKLRACRGCRWIYRRRTKEVSRARVLTIYMLYDILMYKSRFETFKLSEYSEYKRGLGTLKSMGYHVLFKK